MAKTRFRKTPAAARLRAMGKGLRRAQDRVAKSAVGRLTARTLRAGGRLWLGVSARLTVGADRLQAWLPGRLGRAFYRLRALDPFALGGFAIDRIKRDPFFFATYGTFSLLYSNAVIPALMGLGVGPLAATALRFATGTPLDLMAISLRVHSKRRNRSRSLFGTMAQLRLDYLRFAQQRREAHRAHVAGKDASGTLSNLAQGLRAAE